MNIVHVLHEFPLPPNSGVRCDMVRRLAAFRALGHRVLAICWASIAAGEMPSADEQAELDAMTDETIFIPIGADPASRLRRIWNLRRHPSYIASRIPAKAERDALIARVRAFAPDLVWLEGVHPSWLALEIRRRLHVPLAYRAHNIEHRYVAEQAMLARSPRLKLALTAGTWGLEAAECRLQAEADAVYDISADDLAWWQARGYRRGTWLPTQPDPAILATAGAAEDGRDIDLLFLGSLSSPNNVVGLRWYLETVHPMVKAAIPDVSLTIAGRRPPRELAELAARCGASIVADPPEAAPLFARARVTLNPILHGSGVNIKTIDMLAAGRPVITTTKGARGLPHDVVAELSVADDPAPFAEAAIAAVRSARAGKPSADRNALIERTFGIGAVARALAPFAVGQAA